MSVLELDGVTKTYGPDVVALDRVSLRVERGELFTIVGRSGSGKSTLMNIMGTLDAPTSGTVRVDGQDTSGLTDRETTELRARSIGFVFQSFHLDDGQTATENVMTGLLYAGVPRRRRRGLAAEALDRVGLDHRLLHRPPQLSGGERQRVAIARAIAKDPAIVLADEPTGALDSRNGELVMGLLEQLSSEGATIAVITHDATVAARSPRRVALHDGVIVGADHADGDARSADAARPARPGGLARPSDAARPGGPGAGAASSTGERR